MLIIAGFKRSRENEFGREAVTGEALFCPGYIWPPSVFLLLAHEYLQQE